MMHLKTTTQNEQGLNRLRANAQIFFCVGTFIEFFFLSFLLSNDIKFHLIRQIWAKILQTDTVLWGKSVRCSGRKQKSKETRPNSALDLRRQCTSSMCEQSLWKV